jgi:zinc/manganese transport system permease protein
MSLANHVNREFEPGKFWLDRPTLVTGATGLVGGWLVRRLLAWYSFRERVSGFGFYALFAFTVTASVQLVGIYLVFACLIIPALATRSIASRGLRNFCGYAIGAAGCCAGLMISVAHDFPSGAVMVWTLTIAAWLFAVFVVPAISRRSTSG